MSDYDIQKAENLYGYLNSMGSNYKEFIKVFKSSHRTIQQSFTKLCIMWLQYLSEQEYYDDRNKASVLFAKSIKEQLDNVTLPYI